MFLKIYFISEINKTRKNDMVVNKPFALTAKCISYAHMKKTLQINFSSRKM